MPKKIRKSILAGQITLFVLGMFLILIAIDIGHRKSQLRWYEWYTGPEPFLVFILGIVCIIGAILLFSVVRYEVKEKKPEHVCPNCGQKVLEGSKFCNNCGHEIK